MIISFHDFVSHKFKTQIRWESRDQLMIMHL